MGSEDLGFEGEVSAADQGRDEWSDLEAQARAREKPELYAHAADEALSVDPNDYEADPEAYWQDAGIPPAADAQPEE